MNKENKQNIHGKKSKKKNVKKNEANIFFIVAVCVAILVVVIYFAYQSNLIGTSDVEQDADNNEQSISLDEINEGNAKSDAPRLPDDVELNDGSVIKKDDIDKVAEEFIPESLPKEITSMEDLIKYNEYVETLPDGKQKEMLLLKMQIFLEQNQ